MQIVTPPASEVTYIVIFSPPQHTSRKVTAVTTDNTAVTTVTTDNPVVMSIEMSQYGELLTVV